MANKDLINQLEGLFSHISPESAVEEADEGSLLKEVVAGLLEGEAVTDPDAAEPEITQVLLATLTELEAEGNKDGSLLEQAVAGLFEDEAITEPDAVAPAIVEAPLRPLPEPVEAKQEETKTPPLSVSSLKVTPKKQCIRIPDIVLRISLILFGLLLLFLLIGLIWPTPITWSGFRILYGAGCVIAIAITVVQGRFNNSLTDVLREAEEKQAEAVHSQTRLEERVEQLATANNLLQQRVLKFQRANQVSHAFNSALGLDELVQEAVNLICDRFDLYHVGLFLIDESGQWAVLRAGTLARVAELGQAGEFGRPMLANDHQLEVGGASTIGWCTANVQALIAPDLDEKAIRLDNLLLPEAYTELTLPLRSRERVIGALDLQSVEPQAFSQEDIDILQIVADQMAIAIDNAQASAALKVRSGAAEEFRRSTTTEQRPGFNQGPVVPLYERTQSEVTPLNDKRLPEVEKALTRREMIVQAGTNGGVGRAALIAPITLRGEVIGVLGFQEEHGRQWTTDEIALVQDVTTQVALAAENVHLFNQTQEALEETSKLYRASRAIGAAASIHELANVLLVLVAESDFDRGLVLIGEQDADKLKVVVGWDRLDRPFEVGALMDMSQVSPELVIYSDQDQSDALPNRKALNKTWRRWMIGGEEGALAAVPILLHGLPLGLLLIESRHADQLSEAALQPFVTLAAQAAVATENRRLFEKTRRAAEEESLLNEMLRNMATALDVPSIMQAVQDSLAQLVPFGEMSLALVNEETSTLEVFHPGTEQSGHEHIVPKGKVVVSLQGTLVSQAVNSRNTEIIDLTDPNLQGLEVEPLRQAGIQTCVIVPIMYGHDLLGSLNLGHCERDAYASADVPLLERVAQLVAVALENARLFGQLSQRAVQLQTAAQVSQAATSILSPDQLLTQAVELIREQFNLYYVGLFMVDEANEWAVLRAGSGEAGRIQLERGHRLKVGGESMIGSCMANAQARIALDVGEEATRFNNPFLPDTRSELALPLISRGRTIGALSVQSTSQAAFSPEDVTTLQTMADQLANAIQNARFVEQTQRALAETEALYLASADLNTAQSHEDVLDVLRGHTLLGQEAQNVSLNFFDHPWTTDERPEWIEVAARISQLPIEAVSPRYPLSAFPSAAELLHPDTPTLIEDIANDPHMDDQARALYLQRFGARSTIFVPLVVGGQWIGFINGIYQQATTFPEPKVRRLMALSGQAAAVAQGLRQLQEIQARARREALIREITGKVRASTNLETILQTTVAEVSKALGTSHGAIRLGTEGPAEREGFLKTDGDLKRSRPPSPTPLPAFLAQDLAEERHEIRPSVAAARGNDADAPQNESQTESTSPPRTAGKGGQE